MTWAFLSNNHQKYAFIKYLNKRLKKKYAFPYKKPLKLAFVIQKFTISSWIFQNFLHYIVNPEFGEKFTISWTLFSKKLVTPEKFTISWIFTIQWFTISWTHCTYVIERAFFYLGIWIFFFFKRLEQGQEKSFE